MPQAHIKQHLAASLLFGFILQFFALGYVNYGTKSFVHFHAGFPFSRLVVLITFLAILSILSRTCVPWFLKLMVSLSSQVPIDSYHDVFSVF